MSDPFAGNPNVGASLSRWVHGPCVHDGCSREGLVRTDDGRLLCNPCLGADGHEVGTGLTRGECPECKP